MRTADAIKHFGTQAKLAEALGLKQPTISGWGDEVPYLRQLHIERVTKGKLRADLPDNSKPQAA